MAQRTLKVETRRSLVRRWKDREHAAAKLWCSVWGGQVKPAPTYEYYDFTWHDGHVVHGLLEVKDQTLATAYKSAVHGADCGGPGDGPPYAALPLHKYCAAIAAEAMNLTYYFIYCTAERVLWCKANHPERVAVWKKRDPVSGDFTGDVVPVALYAFERMHLLGDELIRPLSPTAPGKVVAP